MENGITAKRKYARHRLSSRPGRHLYLWLVCVCVYVCVNLWHWVNGPVLVSTAAVRAPQCTGPGSGANTNHTISMPVCVCVCVCVCACMCMRPHLNIYVLQCPPLNSEGGFAHIHTHTHTRTRPSATHTRTPAHIRARLGSAPSLGGPRCKCLWSKPS